MVKGRNLTFFCIKDGQFLDPIVRHFSKHNTVNVIAPNTYEEVVHWRKESDLVWCEWADVIASVTSGVDSKKPLIVRLHSYEAFNIPAEMKWDKISKVVFVNNGPLRVLEEALGKPLENHCVIHNGVDVDTFSYSPRKIASGKIGLVGPLHYRKNLPLAIQLVTAIRKRGDKAELHVIGEWSDGFSEEYCRRIAQKLDCPVMAHEKTDDMVPFYNDVSFVLSTSLWESFHYSVAEGMSMGCLPLIHDWEGADLLYPKENIWADIDSGVELFHRLRTVNADTEGRRMSQWIKDLFNMKDKLKEIDLMVEGVLDGSK